MDLPRALKSLLLIFSFLLAGCGSSNVAPFTPAPLTTPVAPQLRALQVNGPNPLIAVGTETSLTALGTFSDGGTTDLTASAEWTSSDPMVGAVVAPGQVEGRAQGMVTITARVGEVSADFQLEVVNAVVTDLMVTSPVDPPGVFRGDTVGLKAIAVLADGNLQDVTEQARWDSNAPSLAAVSNETGRHGEVTGVSVGTATVSANYVQAGRSFSDALDLTVTAAPELILGSGTHLIDTSTGVLTTNSVEIGVVPGWIPEENRIFVSRFVLESGAALILTGDAPFVLKTENDIDLQGMLDRVGSPGSGSTDGNGESLPPVGLTSGGEFSLSGSVLLVGGNGADSSPSGGGNGGDAGDFLLESARGLELSRSLIMVGGDGGLSTPAGGNGGSAGSLRVIAKQSVTVDGEIIKAGGQGTASGDGGSFEFLVEKDLTFGETFIQSTSSVSGTGKAGGGGVGRLVVGGNLEISKDFHVDGGNSSSGEGGDGGELSVEIGGSFTLSSGLFLTGGDSGSGPGGMSGHLALRTGGDLLLQSADLFVVSGSGGDNSPGGGDGGVVRGTTLDVEGSFLSVDSDLFFVGSAGGSNGSRGNGGSVETFTFGVGGLTTLTRTNFFLVGGDGGDNDVDGGGNGGPGGDLRLLSAGSVLLTDCDFFAVGGNGGNNNGSGGNGGEGGAITITTGQVYSETGTTFAVDGGSGGSSSPGGNPGPAGTINLP